MSDTTHSIIHSAKRFLSGTMLSRISGLLRDVAMAYAFGTQTAVAAFLVAFRLAHLLRRLFGEGALQSAFTPHFETLRLENPQRAASFFRDLNATLSVGLFFLIAAVMMILGLILYGVDLEAGNREIIFYTLLLMPSLLFICLFGLNASLLQCGKSYFIPGVAPAAFNIIWILGVWFLYQTSSEQAMPLLAGWVILACLAQWLMTIPGTWKMIRQAEQKATLFKFKLLSEDVVNLGKPLFLGILGVAATQINNACDALFARYAEPEGPAFLWYALRIQQLPLALFGVAISGALLPPLTRALKSGDLVKYRQFLSFAIERSIAFMLPITLLLLICGENCIGLIYGHGDFLEQSITGTTRCLWGYSLGLVPMTLVIVLAPAFFAKGQMRIPAVASLMAMGLNLVLNTWMIAGFGFGAASVAIATSISAWMNLFFLAWSLTEINEVVTLQAIQRIGKIVLATVTATALSIFMSALLHEQYFTSKFIYHLLQCMSAGLCFGAVFLMILPQSSQSHRETPEFNPE